MKKRLDSKKIALAGILVGIVALMSVTPLGFIPLGPLNATINHIPVIIGSLIGGPIVGAMTGLGFGLISWVNSFLRPNLTSFVFWNPLISVIPRILVGIVPYYVHQFIKGINNLNKTVVSVFFAILASIYFVTKFREFYAESSYWYILVWAILYLLLLLVLYLNIKNDTYSLEVSLAAASGAIVNTGLVMGLVYILYAERFASAIGMSTDNAGSVVLSMALVNGIPEAIISVIIVSSLVSRIKRS